MPGSIGSTRSARWNPVAVACLGAVFTATGLAPGARAADSPAGGSAAAIALAVDATDIDHRLLRVDERLPVQPGPLTLRFPHWIPGTHGPAGNVARLAGLRLQSSGADGGAATILEWQRDPASVESFRVTIPPGAATLNIAFEYLSSTRDTEDNQVIHDLLAVNWRNLLLYPAGSAAADIVVTPAVLLPPGWDAASALREAGAAGSAIAATGGAPQWRRYPPLSLEMLIDSPVYSAPVMRHVPLDPDPQHPVVLHILANEPAQIAASEEQLNAYVQLVHQTRELFGARHYDHYDFILVIDDQFGFRGGLEHHQSSENSVRRGYFLDGDRALAMRSLLPHEFAHSWNGKFRRPRDLWTADYNMPMHDSLLWVYEGLTNYWGQVLAARCGLVNGDAARSNFAWQAAGARQRAGRLWRNLQDTTNEPIIARPTGRKDWIDWQRGADYYDEGSLLWLAVDVKLRQLTRDRRSLDDFAHVFFGVDDGRVAPELYGFDDIVQALDGVAHFDWAAFLRQRLDTHEATGLLDGIEGSGWTLSYADKPGAYARSLDELVDSTSLIDSIGMVVGKDGAISRVTWDGPAFTAGLAPGNTLVAVNARSFRPDLLRQAVAAARTAPGPVVLLVKDADVYRNVAIDYHQGLRYPRLERAAGAKDLLGEILAPR